MNRAASTELRPARDGSVSGYMLAEQKAVLRTLGASEGLKSDGEILRAAAKFWVEAHGKAWPQRIRVI